MGAQRHLALAAQVLVQVRADCKQGCAGHRRRQADPGNPDRGNRDVDTCTRKDCDLAGRVQDGCEGVGADKCRRGGTQAGYDEGKGQDGKGCERRVRQGGVSKAGTDSFEETQGGGRVDNLSRIYILSATCLPASFHITVKTVKLILVNGQVVEVMMRDSTDFKNILKVCGAYCLVEDGTLTAVGNVAALKASPALLLRMICRLVLAYLYPACLTHPACLVHPARLAIVAWVCVPHDGIRETFFPASECRLRVERLSPIASKACFGVTKMLLQYQQDLCLKSSRDASVMHCDADPAGKKIFIGFRDDNNNSSKVVGIVIPDDAALLVRRDRQFGSGCREVLGVPASCTVVNTRGAHDLVEHFYCSDI